VVSVGLTNQVPILNPYNNFYVYPADQPSGDKQTEARRSADFRIVFPGYLKTMGIPLLAGRDIAETDTGGSPRVMIISESMADDFFPDHNPLGQKLIVDTGEMIVHEVVGVVADARLNEITKPPRHAMYMSYYQVPRTSMGIVVRTESDPTALVGPIREILRAKDRNIPLAEPAAMASILDNELSDFRITTFSLGLFSSIAMLLALVGLYGVLAYHVSQRYHEIGVRMALGAGARQVARQVLSRGMGLVAVGLVVGLVGSYWATKLIQQILFGVEPTDPATFIVAASGFGLIGFIACMIPAWRATRVDPVLTLQAE
jgi:putative ABC transport system permease protein